MNESLTGLERHEGELLMTMFFISFPFFANPSNVKVNSGLPMSLHPIRELPSTCQI